MKYYFKVGLCKIGEDKANVGRASVTHRRFTKQMDPRPEVVDSEMQSALTYDTDRNAAQRLEIIPLISIFFRLQKRAVRIISQVEWRDSISILF